MITEFTFTNGLDSLDVRLIDSAALTESSACLPVCLCLAPLDPLRISLT